MVTKSIKFDREKLKEAKNLMVISKLAAACREALTKIINEEKYSDKD